MSKAWLSGANLSGTDLSSANLSDANLRGANLIRVRGLTIEQLSSVETLCDAELSSERIKQVRKKYPHLLGERGLDEEKLRKRKIITLRSSYKTLSLSEVQSMPNVSISKKGHFGFYCHSTINRDYNLKAIRGDKVVVDNATGLMWHQSGSDGGMIWNSPKKWVEDLNSEEGCAGYNDWRLPTVDEAASLLESSEKNGGLCIDPVFSNKQECIWTGDKFEYEDGSETTWCVGFRTGSPLGGGVFFRIGRVYRVDSHIFYHLNGVRPVRSME